jgi:two-component system chemotaxis sensor kinase CheA
MGLSVVQEAVTRLQGEVVLSRGPHGAGTSVRIVVPLSVSAQRLLLVSSRGQVLAIPVHGVERLSRIKPAEIEELGGQPVLLVQDKPIPVGNLSHLLGVEGEDSGPRDLLPVVIVRSGSRRLAVIVDALLGERDALIKDLGPPAGRGDRWAGGILLEDGSVCLVLNPAALFRTENRSAADSPAQSLAGGPVSTPRPAKKKTPTILVVDDSLTTRTLEKSILEAHGYRVRIALDGLEALTQLRTDLPDLVITDIQMPRLDGFGLLEQMKKDPRLARIPVIVVTSLEKREDQERGLALGADAYVVKRKFDHEELLQTVRQIL